MGYRGARPSTVVVRCRHEGVEVDNPAMGERRWVCVRCLGRVYPGPPGKWLPCDEEGKPLPYLPNPGRVARR